MLAATVVARRPQKQPNRAIAAAGDIERIRRGSYPMPCESRSRRGCEGPGEFKVSHTERIVAEIGDMKAISAAS
jgi:hypothetical protein